MFIDRNPITEDPAQRPVKDQPRTPRPSSAEADKDDAKTPAEQTITDWASI